VLSFDISVPYLSKFRLATGIFTAQYHA